MISISQHHGFLLINLFFVEIGGEVEIVWRNSATACLYVVRCRRSGSRSAHIGAVAFGFTVDVHRSSHSLIGLSAGMHRGWTYFQGPFASGTQDVSVGRRGLRTTASVADVDVRKTGHGGAGQYFKVVEFRWREALTFCASEDKLDTKFSIYLGFRRYLCWKSYLGLHKKRPNW